MTKYSLDILFSWFGTSLLFHVQLAKCKVCGAITWACSLPSGPYPAAPSIFFFFFFFFFVTQRGLWALSSPTRDGPQPCLTQWNYEPCRVGHGSWWRVLTKHGPLEKGMANHFSVFALRTPWTFTKYLVLSNTDLNFRVHYQPTSFFLLVVIHLQRLPNLHLHLKFIFLSSETFQKDSEHRTNQQGWDTTLELIIWTLE